MILKRSFENVSRGRKRSLSPPQVRIHDMVMIRNEKKYNANEKDSAKPQSGEAETPRQQMGCLWMYSSGRQKGTRSLWDVQRRSGWKLAGTEVDWVFLPFLFSFSFSLVVRISSYIVPSIFIFRFLF
jgi:hypothetical protein